MARNERQAYMDWRTTYGDLSPQYLEQQSAYERQITDIANKYGLSRQEVKTGMDTGNLSAIFKKIISSAKKPRLLPASYDVSRVESLSQRLQSPALRRLLAETRRAVTPTSDNPNVNALQRRSALEGFGRGYEDIAAGARSGAESMYAPEYAAENEALRQNYLADLSEYQAMLEAEINSIGAVKAPQAPVYRNTFIGTRGRPLMGYAQPASQRTEPIVSAARPGGRFDVVSYLDKVIADRGDYAVVPGYGGQSYGTYTGRSGKLSGSLDEDIYKIRRGV